MKAYVDKFPKDCWDCPMHGGENGRCKMLGYYTDYIPKECPLQSLADYTKQVRKEVCKKFVEQFMLEYTMGNEPVEDIIYKVANQIQGE